MTGELLGQVHGLLADAEELLEAGVEARVVRCETNVEQMRVQALDLEHDGADVLGARRDMDALGTLDGLGIGHRVGAAADTADAVGEERHGIIVQARLGNLLHAAVHVEERVVVSPSTNRRKWPGSSEVMCNGPMGTSVVSLPLVSAKNS